MPGQVPVIEGLFSETPDGPRLHGTRCAGCRWPYFPRATACNNPDCTEEQIEEASFGPRGTLWSCAVQNYPPPAPARHDEPYIPYALGLVDLSDGLRVLGRVITADPASLIPGSEVKLVLDTLCHEEDGTEVITWKFKPV